MKSPLYQITKAQKKLLEKQKYRVVGNHSAVKICGWTRNKLAGKGECYKEKFYGIKCHQCMQMTSSLYCANACKFCWRSSKLPISKEWKGEIDNPDFIIENSIKQHIKLLQGFKGNKKADKKLLKEMADVKHVALSLTGEAITYPKLNELLNMFHKKKISTFLVTNGQFPDEIKKIKNITQLYISLDAPTREKLKELDRPIFDDYWERLMKSLKNMSRKKFRTAIRLTLIKNENMSDIGKYAKLIKLSNADFIEVKSYMWVGDSQKFYITQDMPRMNEIKKFSEELLSFLPDYEYADEHNPSRVVLLIKKSLKKAKYINFNKFFELSSKEETARAEEYSIRNL
ncbi:MAG: 4-demethylwyosine synthase TYW1 [Candidatus Pacearchaeota archaeon]